MTDLNPCPFCGDPAMVQRIGPHGNKWWEVQCGGCGISGPDRGNETDAITAWNTRAQTDSRLDTAMKLLRDNQSVMHFSREITTADDDVLRAARSWR